MIKNSFPNRVLGAALLAILLVFVSSVIQVFAKDSFSQSTFLKTDLFPFFIGSNTTLHAASTEYHFFTAVKNKGTITSGLTKTRFRIDLHTDGSWDLGILKSTSPLNPQQTEGELWASAVFVPKETLSGTNILEVCADATHSEAESNEVNNCRQISF